MKRIAAVFLAFLVIIGTLPVTAQTDDVITASGVVELYSKGQFPDSSKAQLLSASQGQIDECVNVIQSELLKYKEGFSQDVISVQNSDGTVTYVDVYLKQINIASFGIQISDIDTVIQKALDIPELFYMRGEYNYGYYSSGNVVYVTAYRDIFYTDEEIEKRQTAVDSEVNRVLSGIKSYMTDAEKAMYVHDYIVLNYTYDYTYSNFSIDSFVTDKKGVCQAYSYMYMYILNKLGIECIFVPSDALKHAWNQVKIDNLWYHVDTTWDDANRADYIAHSNYSNFLVSDECIRKNGHSEWNSNVTNTADDTRFDDALWRKANVPVIHKQNECYYKKDDAIYRYGKSESTEEKIYTINSIWNVFGETSNKFSTLGEYDGTLYFNTQNAIYTLNLNETDSNGNVKTEVFADTDEIENLIGIQDISKTYIYGMFIDNGNLYFDFCTTPNETAQARYCIKMPTEQLPCRFYTKNESNTITVTPKKNDYTGKAVMYIAVYDADGKLIEIKPQEITDWQPLEYTIQNTEKAVSTKIMLWDNSCNPLSPGKSIPFQAQN